MKKLIIIIGVLALVVAGITFLGIRTENELTKVSAGDPIDPVIEFYDEWLDTVKSTTTNPVEAGLLNNEILTESVREYITSAQADPELTIDPVLCQSVTPNRVGAKISYHLETKAQLLIIARGGEEKSSEMAVVDLDAIDGEWKISKISCSSGESAPKRDFSFEHEGFLLKSVPPPLNPEYWHLVFVENGIDGHTAPLFFDTESICVAGDSTQSVCDETQFAQATKVYVQGEMTETGVNVKKVIFSN